MTTVNRHRLLNVLLAALLALTASVAMSGGQPSDAVEGPVDVVYVASGRNFPDALVGGGLAVSMGAPMLTVEPSRIPDATATALTSLDPDRIIVLGGPGAVSDDVATALAAYARSGVVERIEGADRHGTAAAIADALPDKVADADHLDGLDSTDFIRTTDDLDADTLDGRDSTSFADAADMAAQRVLGLSGWRLESLGEWQSAPVLPESGNAGASTLLMVPPGHHAGTGLTVDLLISESDFGACSVKFVVQGVGTLVDQVSASSSFVNWHGPGANDFDFVLNTPAGRSAHLVGFTLDPERLDDGYDEPGTAHTFTIRRTPDDPLDTCTSAVVIRGAQLRY